MREILFKAKIKGSNQWVIFNSMVTSRFAGCVFVRDSPIIYDGKFPLLFQNEVITETICQFTGSTNVHGEKIFEGDILRSINHYEGKKPYYSEHIIQWSDKFNGWFAKHKDNLGKEDTNGDVQLWIYLKNTEFEITSNIHD